MKYIWNDIATIEKTMKAHETIALFLDFDGTLVPIADKPHKIILSTQTKKLLEELASRVRIHAAIISGRTLEEIKHIIGIPNLIYGGNHGLEWQIGSQTHTPHFDKKTALAFDEIRSRVQILEKQFPGLFVEDKLITLSLHYRMVDPEKFIVLRRNIRKLLAPYAKNNTLSIIEGRKVFDVCPNKRFTKGHISTFFLKTIRLESQKNPVPIYIGDDTTDEDAFSDLAEAITIRVGENRESQARYYLEDIDDVLRFIKWLLEKMS